MGYAVAKTVRLIVPSSLPLVTKALRRVPRSVRPYGSPILVRVARFLGHRSPLVDQLGPLVHLDSIILGVCGLPIMVFL